MTTTYFLAYTTSGWEIVLDDDPPLTEFDPVSADDLLRAKALAVRMRYRCADLAEIAS